MLLFGFEEEQENLKWQHGIEIYQEGLSLWGNPKNVKRGL